MPVVGASGLEIGITAETFGLVQNAEVNHTVDKTEGRNEAGDIEGVAYYGDKKEVSMEYLWLSDTGNPAASVGNGSAFSFSDSELPDAFIEEAATKFSNTEFKMQTIKGTNYPDLGS